MRRKDNKYSYAHRGDAIVHTIGSVKTIRKNIKALREACEALWLIYDGTNSTDYTELRKQLDRLANKLEKLAQEVK